MSRREKILVAMSGGVDSSVAACLLHEQGHEVVGVFMRLGSGAGEAGSGKGEVGSGKGEGGSKDAGRKGGSRTVQGIGSGRDPGLASSEINPASPAPLAPRPDSRVPTSDSRIPTSDFPIPTSDFRLPTFRPRGCCSADDAADARAVAGRLGIAFYALNFQAEFARLIDYFADEYAAARTPNPCVMCNQWLKFGRLLDYADAVGAGRVATGHYARVIPGGRGPELHRAAFAEKDQSYVLFGLSPAALGRTIFPLGELTKDEVRATARRFGLALHDKPESQDICFAPDRDHAAVVRARRPEAFKPGPIRHVDGRLLGEHAGLGGFTVGQRRGTGIALGEPAYVTRLDAASNTLVLGPREAVLAGGLRAERFNWLVERPVGSLRAAIRIRYNHAAVPGTATPLDGGRLEARFDEPQKAVTPGQAVVLYDGDRVLGGGWIEAPL